jgi:hypothetical protein
MERRKAIRNQVLEDQIKVFYARIGEIVPTPSPPKPDAFAS